MLNKEGGSQMEIVIIGGIAAGMSVAAKASRTNKEANITVIRLIRSLWFAVLFG